MLLRVIGLLLLFYTFVLAQEVKGEYSISSLQNISQASKDRYFDIKGLPDLYVSKQCRKKCKKDCCWDVLRDVNGNIVRNYSTSDDVYAIARNRYKNKSYLLFAHTYGPKKKRKTKYHLVDNNLKEYDVPSFSGNTKKLITKDANLVEASSYGVYLNGLKQYDSKKFESIEITNNPEGDIAIGGITQTTRTIFVSDFKSKKWLPANITLAQHSDTKDIFSVYPDTNSTIYAVAYNLINIYNKGLLASSVNFKTGQTHAGWIYNYEKFNIGFNPEVYVRDKNIVINAKNSSTGSNVSFNITPQEFAQIDKSAPQRDGFEDESYLSFMVGAGVEMLEWYANTEVKKDDVSYAQTDYELSGSIYKKIYLQGRAGDTQLAISYMKNEAKKVGGLTEKASETLNFFIDFNALLSKSSTLRIAYTSSNINGIATFTDFKNGATCVTPDGTQVEFETKIERYSLLVMKERGFYAGAEYTSFQTPSTVGFSNSAKNIAYYGLDPEFKIKNLEFVFGHDTAAYAKRYETNFNTLYLQGMGGLGLSYYDMSSDFEKSIKAASGKKIVSSDISFVVDLEIQLGYLWQQRSKMLKGLGYSFDIGVKARGSYTGSGQSDDSDNTIEANEITMEMDRYDVWYGPYAYFNLMF